MFRLVPSNANSLYAGFHIASRQKKCTKCKKLYFFCREAIYCSTYRFDIVFGSFCLCTFGFLTEISRIGNDSTLGRP